MSTASSEWSVPSLAQRESVCKRPAHEYDSSEVRIMPGTEAVTIALPLDVVRDIDRMEPNRSKFILDAVHHELQRRRREPLELSLREPHPESARIAEEGFDEWARNLPEEDVRMLVDMQAGTPVRWVPGEGWVEAAE
jgi:hypothetical protein